MSFGKMGRPPEDRLARQREIYAAISPLLLQQGARALSMRQAAAAAHLSIGGLCHYFPTKRELVLFGILPETTYRFCQDFQQRFNHLSSGGFQQYFDEFYAYLLEATLFMRPSVRAGAELGVDIFARSAEIMDTFTAEVVSKFRSVVPTVPEAQLGIIAQAIGHFCLAAVIDMKRTDKELRAEFYLLIGGALEKEGIFLQAMAS